MTPSEFRCRCGAMPLHSLCAQCADVVLAAERERLKTLVLAFATNKMHRPWLAELAALFEAP